MPSLPTMGCILATEFCTCKHKILATCENFGSRFQIETELGGSADWAVTKHFLIAHRTFSFFRAHA